MPGSFLILLAAGSIVLLLYLIIGLKLPAFVALLVVSLVMALAAGVPLAEIPALIQEGMGRTLGYIAVVIGVGAMLGEILRISGGAEQVARALVLRTGDDRAPWGLTAVGLIVAVPVFFDVALILLIPLVYNLARRSGKSLLYYAIPLVAGIAVGHSFIPPTPGPVTVAALLGADLGWVILFGCVAGLPAALVGGVFWGRYIGARLHIPVPTLAEPTAQTNSTRHIIPSVGTVLALITLPMGLILLNTASAVWLETEHPGRQWLAFVGHPFTALIATLLLAFYFLGARLGFSRQEIQQVATRSIEPVGMIILLTGAGGVFGKVLISSGVGDALAASMAQSQIPVLVFGFLIAMGIRVLQGSATVAMVTAAGLIAPVLSAGDYSVALIGAVVVAIAAGATVLSHVNDTGFWLVKQFLGMTEKQTLASWTVMETIVGLVALTVLLAVSTFL